jgi:hypothetical protein
VKRGLGLVTINSKVSVGVTIIIILLFSPWIYPNAQAQNNLVLTPAEKFSIPLYNGTLSFAFNGTYSKATLENDSWTFTNLNLMGSQTLQNFTVSAQNSNITIDFYSALNFTRRSSLLLYTVEGQGKQVFNFGQATGGEKFTAVDWSVIVGNNFVFLPEGQEWTISSDGTIFVNGVSSGNVSIIHWAFFDSSTMGSNLPFYQQHSVALAIVVSLSVVVAASVVMKVRETKSPKNDELAKAKKLSPKLKYREEEPKR